MPIRCVLFDLGDTLWHIPSPPPVDSIRKETVSRISELLRSWGVEPDGDLFFLGRDIRMALERALAKAYGGDLLEPHSPTLTREVAAEKGLDLTPEKSEQLWETWNLGGPFFGRRLFDGAIEALQELRDRGYRLGCVTNRSFSGASFIAEVADFGLADLFDVMSVSCDLGYMKPHPKIFEHAMEALDVQPQEMAMVGDSLRADVAGSQKMGMTAVWRRPLKIREKVDGVEPDFTVSELSEIPDLPCFSPDWTGPASGP